MEISNIVKEEYYKMLNESIKVYHGTSSNFKKFNLSKIGTGDGKSLGGWGLYFSDSFNVSDRYKINKGWVKSFLIPDGEYFDLDEIFSDQNKFVYGLKKLRINNNIIEEFINDFPENDYVTNKQVYDYLSYILKGEKKASLFIKSLGYIGNTFIDKWDSDARNYVLFDTINIKPYEDDGYNDENYY